MLHPPVKTSRHLDMKITCFNGQVNFPADGFVLQGQSSRSRIPVVEVQVTIRAGTKRAACLKPPNPPQGPPSKLYVQQQPGPRPTVFKGVQGCRLPGLKRSKCSARLPIGKPYVLLNPPSRSQDRPCPTVFRQALRPAAARATPNCF